MTKNQYRILCDACDSILNNQDLPSHAKAVSFLHVIREHPVFLSQYEPLFEGSANTGRGPGIKALGKLLFFFIRCGICNWAATLKSRSLVPIDVLFVSHLVDREHIKAASDFYFSNIPQFLSKNDTTSAVALIDHTKSVVRAEKRVFSHDGIPRIILGPHKNLFSALAEIPRLLRVRSRISRMMLNGPAGLAGRIARGAQRETISSSTLLNLGVAAQVQTLVKKLRPRAIVVTYEGHAWERLVFAAAKTARSEILCVGYHHTNPLPLQHSLNRNLGYPYDPDLVLESGEAGFEYWKNPGDDRVKNVVIAGSCRRPVAAPGQAQREGRGSSEKLTCLVMPEGIETECRTLIGFARECAAAAPEIRFVIRMHPVLPFSKFSSANPSYKSLPENVFLSDTSLQNDLNLAQWVLYRGTSAVIQAVLSGVQPLYLDREGEMPIDPLYGLSAWKKTIGSPETFCKIIRTYSNARDDQEQEEVRTAQDFCEKYFTPIDFEAIKRHLAAGAAS